MSKTKINQKGFSAVEAVLVIVILVLIGAVGWLVYKNHHKNITTTTTSTITPTPTTPAKPSTPAAPANPYAGWKSYTTSYGLSFMYPSNWTVSTTADTSDVAVSLISKPTSEFRTTQSLYPQYNDDLVLFISSEVPSGKYTSFTASYESLASTVNVNGTNYCVLGSTNSADSGDPVTQYILTTCDAKNETTLGNMVFGSKGVYATISSAGNGGAATVPISQSNTDYAKIISIVESFKF